MSLKVFFWIILWWINDWVELVVIVRLVMLNGSLESLIFGFRNGVVVKNLCNFYWLSYD